MNLKTMTTSELIDALGRWLAIVHDPVLPVTAQANNRDQALALATELHERLGPTLTLRQWGRCCSCGAQIDMQSTGVSVGQLVDTAREDEDETTGLINVTEPMARTMAGDRPDPYEVARNILNAEAERAQWPWLRWRAEAAHPWEPTDRYAVVALLPHPDVKAEQLVTYGDLQPYEPGERTTLNGIDVATNYEPRPLVCTLTGDEDAGRLDVEPVLWEHSHVTASHVFFVQGRADDPKPSDLIFAHVGVGKPGEPFTTYDGELSVDFNRGMVRWGS